MRQQVHLLITCAFVAATLAVSTGVAVADGGKYCMDVELGPFHMLPGSMDPDGACAVKDYLDGELQEEFYPFTIEDHRFNCDLFGEEMTLPTGQTVPTSVVSEGEVLGEPGDITGTIGGHAFSAKLLCASLTNWYEEYCTDPTSLDPEVCFQLKQPFMGMGVPRVTEVSIFDGVIAVETHKGEVMEVPVLMVTRAAGITHLEVLEPPEDTEVGASVTHSLLALLTYEADDDEDDDGIEAKVLDGSLDLLLQGHIFSPDTVEQDEGPAMIKGAICSKGLYKTLNEKGRKGHKGGKGHHDDDE